MAATIEKLGILAGKGALPAQIATYCEAKNIPYFILAFEESLDAKLVEGREHAVISIGAIGRGMAILHEQGVKQVVLAGHVKRPSFRNLEMDAEAKRLLKKLGMKILGGDDALLGALVSYLEESGLQVLGSHEILGGITLDAGIITKAKPSKEHAVSIEKAAHTLKHMSELDVGQSLVIEDGYVLGIEAAEGTDGLILRCKDYMKSERQAVLVKMKKSGQNERADMPTIGPQTISHLANGGYAGLAVQAHHTLVLEKDEVIRLADEAGLFIVAL